MAIGRSLQSRREILDAAEQLCGDITNMIKARAVLLCFCFCLARHTPPLQVKSLDVEGSKQALADARAKDSMLQQRLDAEQASLHELEQRIEQLLRREDNLYCIEARARKHNAEAGFTRPLPVPDMSSMIFTKSPGVVLHRPAVAAEKCVAAGGNESQSAHSPPRSLLFYRACLTQRLPLPPLKRTGPLPSLPTLFSRHVALQTLEQSIKQAVDAQRLESEQQLSLTAEFIAPKWPQLRAEITKVSVWVRDILPLDAWSSRCSCSYASLTLHVLGFDIAAFA
jgi:hypothetical protein